MHYVGIIILNYNTWKETISCVESIAKYTSIQYRIYIVDNLSKDESVSKLLDEYDNNDKVKIIANGQNNGYSAGNNIGIIEAQKDNCEYIFIVNSDVELLNNAFDIMINTLNKNDKYMMIGPSVMDINYNESQLPRKIMTLPIFIMARHPLSNIKFFFEKSNRIIPLVDNPTSFYGSVSGCCFGIKMNDFASVNFFDENVFLYCEEDILAYKMKKLNKMAVVDLDAKVLHKANVSTKKEGNAFVQFHRWTSSLYLLKVYVGINIFQQVMICIWNIVTWDLLSIVSKNHRKMLKEFRKKNWEIVFTDYKG